ncbi:MAG: tetratricopeptide repeat protein, partial [Bacteroidia bacterium]
MKKNLILLFIFLSFSGIAQVNLDSLWKVWNDSSRPDTIRLQAMQRICLKGYLYSKPDSAFVLGKQMLAFAEQKGLKHYQIFSLNILGASCSIQADNIRGIDYFTRSLKLAEEIKDYKSMGQCINNIGVIYYEQGNNKKAEEYYNKSLALNEKLGSKFGIAFALGNLGNVYNNLKQPEKAIEAQNRSLKLSEEIKDQPGVANALHSLANIYCDLNQYDKAIDCCSRALAIYETIEDQFGITGCLTTMGLVYKKQDQIAKATEYFQRALDVAKKASIASGIREASSYLYDINKKSGKSADALQMYELYISMRDSIKSEESQREVMKKEMEYNYEKQKALDEKEQEKQLAVSAEQEKKQKVISYSVGIGLFLVLIFAIFVVNRLRLTSKQKQIIEHQKDLVEEKQKEILDSMNYAKRLQEAILPPANFVAQHLPDSFIFYKPKDIVAGDFYWMEVVNNIIFIAAGDCTGHGVPGAMVSVVCSNALNRAVLEFGISEPGKILDKTRELVLETFSRSDADVKDGMDISLISIAKIPGSSAVTVKWAGANNPLWYVSNKEPKEIKADKQAIGKTENPYPFTTHTIQLQKGDILFLFTDGYADQFGGDKGKKIKSKPLKEMLVSNSIYSSAEQKEKLEVAFREWKGNIEQVDDVC